MLKRIDREFLNPESNEANLESIKSILPHFLLDGRSEEVAQEAIDTDTALSMGAMMDFDAHRRAWFEIDTPPNPDADDGYNFHIRRIAEKTTRGTSWSTDLVNYEVFRSGRLPDGQKLFKYCLKNGLLTQEDVDRINNNRTPTDQLYLCISRNPVDMLFASTNQSFSSCVNLESDYAGAFYMGLPDTWVDPYRCIAFITKGKFKRYTVRGYEFKNFRYIQRSWLILNADGFFKVEDYPSANFSINGLLESADIPISGRYHPSRMRLEQRETLYHENNEECGIYSDCGESYNMSFNWTGGFEDMPDYIDETSGQCCCNCGDYVSDECARYYGDDVYCGGCHDACFGWCEHCEEYYPHDQISGFDDGYYCDTCLDAVSAECEGCQERIGNDELCSDPDGDYAYCETCYGAKFTTCEECEVEIDRDDAIDGYCAGCYADLFLVCKDCGAVVDRDDTTDATDGRCEVCYEALELVEVV